MATYVCNVPGCIFSVGELANIFHLGGDGVKEHNGEPRKGLLEFKRKQHQFSLCGQEVALRGVQVSRCGKGQIPCSQSTCVYRKQLWHMNLQSNSQVIVVGQWRTKVGNISGKYGINKGASSETQHFKFALSH